jgi:CYTH domain-containing protein
MGKVEIERKFLIKEKDKIFACPFQIEDLKAEIKKFGRNITQHYLPLDLIPKLKEKLKFSIKFEPNELRIRKLKDKYYLTIKSKGSTKRDEFEKPITKELFKEYSEKAEKTLKKIRLMKKYKDKFWFIDYYPKYSLIIAEIEFKSLKEAENFNEKLKEITGKKEYKNRNLAK